MRLMLGFDLSLPLESDISRPDEEIAEFAERIDGRKTGQFPRKSLATSRSYLLFGSLPNASSHNTKMSISRLREIVKYKEARAREYTSCDSYWLLVVTDFIDRAQDQNLHTEGFETVVSDVFEKIIVYKTGFGYLLESKS